MPCTYARAEQILQDRLAEGAKHQARLLEKVAATVILDKLVAPQAMHFVHSHELLDPDVAVAPVKLVYQQGKPAEVTLHRHAFHQLCKKVDFPLVFASRLSRGEPWERSLLAYNLTRLFHEPAWKEKGGLPAMFLHRIVGTELRGFLSRRYNRHLASLPLLTAFLDACAKADAQPIEAVCTDVRVSLKCLLPHVFEVFPGEFVAVGAEWSNSDFGAGRLSVCQTAWRIHAGGFAVLDETLSRVHLGSVIQEADIDISEETADKEVSAQQSAIVDAVGHQLSGETVEKFLDAVARAREEDIPWTKLRTQLSKFLSKSELEQVQAALRQQGGVIDLPPVSSSPGGDAVPNVWWACAMLSSLSLASDESDRRLELQREAGKLLAGALSHEAP